MGLEVLVQTNKQKARKRDKLRKKNLENVKRADKKIMAKKRKFKKSPSLTTQIDNFDKMQKYLDKDARLRAKELAEIEATLAGGQAPKGMVGQEPGDPGLFPAAPEYRLDRKKGGKVKKKAKAKSKAFNGNDFVRQVNNYKEM
jgi:hypothetical protein